MLSRTVGDTGWVLAGLTTPRSGSRFRSSPVSDAPSNYRLIFEPVFDGQLKRLDQVRETSVRGTTPNGAGRPDAARHRPQVVYEALGTVTP